MKKLYKLLVAVLILVSCKTNESKFGERKGNMLPDYSESAYEAIRIIIDNLTFAKNSFEVEIVNSFGGRYILKSNIEFNNDSVKIISKINYEYSGTKSDTVMAFSRKEFLEKLNIELLDAESQLEISGSYQTIKVKNIDSSQVFYTKQALGLMRLLKEGKSNRIE